MTTQEDKHSREYNRSFSNNGEYDRTPAREGNTGFDVKLKNEISKCMRGFRATNVITYKGLRAKSTWQRPGDVISLFADQDDEDEFTPDPKEAWPIIQDMNADVPTKEITKRHRILDRDWTVPPSTKKFKHPEPVYPQSTGVKLRPVEDIMNEYSKAPPYKAPTVSTKAPLGLAKKTPPRVQDKTNCLLEPIPDKIKGVLKNITDTTRRKPVSKTKAYANDKSNVPRRSSQLKSAISPENLDSKKQSAPINVPQSTTASSARPRLSSKSTPTPTTIAVEKTENIPDLIEARKYLLGEVDEVEYRNLKNLAEAPPITDSIEKPVLFLHFPKPINEMTKIGKAQKRAAIANTKLTVNNNNKPLNNVQQEEKRPNTEKKTSKSSTIYKIPKRVNKITDMELEEGETISPSPSPIRAIVSDNVNKTSHPSTVKEVDESSRKRSRRREEERSTKRVEERSSSSRRDSRSEIRRERSHRSSYRRSRSRTRSRSPTRDGRRSQSRTHHRSERSDRKASPEPNHERRRSPTRSEREIYKRKSSSSDNDTNSTTSSHAVTSKSTKNDEPSTKRQKKPLSSDEEKEKKYTSSNNNNVSTSSNKKSISSNNTPKPISTPTATVTATATKATTPSTVAPTTTKVAATPVSTTKATADPVTSTKSPIPVATAPTTTKAATAASTANKNTTTSTVTKTTATPIVTKATTTASNSTKATAVPTTTTAAKIASSAPISITSLPTENSISATAPNAETPEQYKVFTIMFNKSAHASKRRGDTETDPVFSILDHFHALCDYILNFYYVDKANPLVSFQKASGAWKSLFPFSDSLIKRLDTHKLYDLYGLCVRLISLIRYYIYSRMESSTRPLLTKQLANGNDESYTDRSCIEMTEGLLREHEKAERCYVDSERFFTYGTIATQFPETFKNVCIHGNVLAGIMLGGEAGVSVGPMFPFTPYSPLHHAAIASKCILSEYVTKNNLRYTPISNPEEFM